MLLRLTSASVLGRVRNQHALEDRDSLHLLLPDHGAQAIVGADELAVDASLVECLGAKAKEPTMLFQKSLGHAVGVVRRNAGKGSGGEARTLGLQFP